ncbi:MAG: TetR/AcrR family transcriptional regulator [Desulfamplus sp.]|nr:TetR/AcrR family transcriptional regulator [Desulfamplus sp.]
MDKKEKKITNKQESILDAAVQSFIQDGYNNSSMDKIAELAGASKRTVYNYFKSKEELFKAVLDRLLSEIMALKQIKYDPKKSLYEQLEDFANAKVDISKNPSWLGLMKVTISVFITNPELAIETVKQAEDAEDSLIAWLNAAKADGRIKAENVELAAEAFWAMMSGAFFWPSIFFEPISDKKAGEMKKELIQIFLARYS